jgi:HAD superfamily hydrolase (TIGR01549 family)
MIEVIFFDFDGTISDSLEQALKNFEKVLKKNDYVVKKSVIKDLMGLKVDEMFAKMKIPRHERNRIKREFFQLMKNDVGKFKLCSDIKPLIALRKTKKHKMVVVSNSDASFIRKSARKLNVNRIFSDFYCAEQFKSKDKILKMLLGQYKVAGKNCLYVGDRFTDVVYARKVGIKSVAVSNKCSWSSLKQLKEKNPDFIIKDFKGLKELVEKIDLRD